MTRRSSIRYCSLRAATIAISQLTLMTATPGFAGYLVQPSGAATIIASQAPAPAAAPRVAVAVDGIDGFVPPVATSNVRLKTVTAKKPIKTSNAKFASAPTTKSPSGALVAAKVPKSAKIHPTQVAAVNPKGRINAAIDREILNARIDAALTEPKIKSGPSIVAVSDAVTTIPAAPVMPPAIVQTAALPVAIAAVTSTNASLPSIGEQTVTYQAPIATGVRSDSDPNAAYRPIPNIAPVAAIPVSSGLAYNQPIPQLNNGGRYARCLSRAALVNPRGYMQSDYTRRWTPEEQGMHVKGVNVSFTVSNFAGADGRQSIRFYVRNETARRALIGFHVEMVSASGKTYQVNPGTILDSWGSVYDSSLEVQPFDPNDCIAGIVLSRPMLCAEDTTQRSANSGYVDNCAAVNTGRTRADAAGATTTLASQF